MTSVQPFSYLTVQPAPSKPAFQRQDDDDDGLVETTLPASAGDDFRGGNLNMVQEDVGVHFSQSSAALAYEAMDYKRPQVNLGRSQTETSYDLRQHQQQQQQQQPEMPFTGNPVKRPPDVAPKQQTKTSDPPPRMPDNWEEGLYGGANRGAGGGGGALYEQSNPLSTIERLQERTDPAAGDTDFGNAGNNVYGQPNRQRKPDVQETRKAEPQLLTTTNNYVPFSYTQPIGLSGDMESRNGIGPKHYYSPSPEPPTSSGVRPRDSPSPPAVNPLENQTIFENFILVGPEKPPPATTTYPALLPPKEQPAKRLKLQELFDPPPPKQPAPVLLQDPRKLSIFGVTNTESSDYQSSANHTKKTNGGGDRTKTPVSTFDNPDYNLPSDGSRAYTPSGSVQGTSDDRSWSVGASNTFDNGKLGTATATAGFSKHRRPTPLQGREKGANNKTCIAVLITALVAGIFCLGAGFIAGWFGRGRSLGY